MDKWPTSGKTDRSAIEPRTKILNNASFLISSLRGESCCRVSPLLASFFSRLASSYIRLSQTLLPGCFFLVMFMRSWISSIFSFVETFMSGKTNLSFTAAVAAFSPELIKGLIRFVEAGRRLTCWVEKRLTGWSAHQNPSVLSKSYFFF